MIDNLHRIFMFITHNIIIIYVHSYMHYNQIMHSLGNSTLEATV